MREQPTTPTLALRWYHGHALDPAHGQAACPACGAALDQGARYCGACGSAIAPTRSSQHQAQTAPPPRNIIGHEVGGRYRILAKLGEGGMGAVYRAEQISLKRVVALKVLKPELSAEPGLVRRFNAEATLAAKLNHPNTVTLFDFGQDDDGSLFIAMEYIEGKSLRQVLVKEGPMAPERLVAITNQICGSLADAHATGIVHRDLKPDNVMLFARGKQTEAVSVLDFGIAKLRDEQGNITQQPMTRAGDILGTPQYMAPEQIRGDRVDPRTDVYALGVMLYEMATARLPFEGATVMALLSKHLTDVPVAPSLRRPELAIPPALSQLIMRCLAKAPDDRPRSMDEVEQALAAMAGPVSLATPARAPAAFAPMATPAATAPTALAGAIATPAATAPTAHAGMAMGAPPTGPNSMPPAYLPTAKIGRPRKSKKGLWILVGLALLGAVGAAGYAMSVPSADDDQGAEDGTFDSVAWENDESGNSGKPDNEDTERDDPVDEVETTETEFYTDAAFNYRMRLPANFRGKSDGMGTATFSGSVHGHEVVILTLAWPASGSLSESDIESELAARLAVVGVIITNMEWRNSQTLVGDVEAPEDERAGEFVFSRRGRVFYFAAAGASLDAMGATKDFRSNFLHREYEVY